MEKLKALELINVNKIYNDGFQAVKDISFCIEEGDFFALLGPNGAGKSTILGMISALVKKTSGQIKIFGYDIEKDYIQARKQLGVMVQEVNLAIFETPMQILYNQAGFYGIPRKEVKIYAEELLKEVDLFDKKDTQVRFLSGGMKRRLMVVRALIHKPKLLILDEPTAGVDVELRNSLWKTILRLHKEGLTVILTTHYLEEAESMCNKIGLIYHGKLHTNCDMKSFLHSVDKEIFVFDLQGCACCNDIKIKSGNVKVIDKNTIEVEVGKGILLNDVFAELSEFDLQILSVKTKTAKLEKLFIDISRGSKKDTNN